MMTMHHHLQSYLKCQHRPADQVHSPSPGRYTKILLTTLSRLSLPIHLLFFSSESLNIFPLLLVLKNKHCRTMLSTEPDFDYFAMKKSDHLSLSFILYVIPLRAKQVQLKRKNLHTPVYGVKNYWQLGLYLHALFTMFASKNGEMGALRLCFKVEVKFLTPK